ncbi:hypothetical protein C8Q76DRAFT_605407 [Earliella scabrosa]|nr:hypothetical protein C8Q76DRAFT_605407 [Earliella scabrosa]
MSFHRQPPPSSPSTSRQPIPLEPTSSSSSSIPSLTSDASSSPESEALASPLRRLALLEELDSPRATRKPNLQLDSPICHRNRASSADDDTRENMLDREYRQNWRSMGREGDHNKGREAPLPSFPSPPTIRPVPSSARPPLHHRTSSYSKRHASFDSPREVPLPYMPSRQPSYSASTSAQTQGTAVVHDSEPPPRLSCIASADAVRPVFDDSVASSSSNSDSSPSSSSSPPTSMGGDSKAARGSVPDFMDLSDSAGPSTFHSSRSVQHPRPQSPRMPSSSSTALPLFSRPFSSPDASRPILSPRPMRPPGVPDRGSTASLPLPADTPFHTLPPFSGGTIQEDQEMRSAAPTRPSSSRPAGGPNQSSTSSIPSSSPWETRRSPSLPSDLEQEEFMSLVANRILDRAYSSAARVSSDRASSVSDRPLPPPEPPTVLTPPPPPLSQDRGPAAPYEPFLAHAPPPQDSYIAVDTKPAEYRLLVRLPGFKRDAITVSTRKRRILHVVADSWEPNGAMAYLFRATVRYRHLHRPPLPQCVRHAIRHFEQRISFGYDALLAQVRAEFDGEHLQVIVPRRMVPMTYHPSRE